MDALPEKLSPTQLRKYGTDVVHAIRSGRGSPSIHLLAARIIEQLLAKGTKRPSSKNIA
jgi:hypothetical protein